MLRAHAGMNVLCGVGILSTPYAVKEGGWAGLSILLIFSVLSFYTGILLRYCLDSEPGLETYPDIGQAAFGTVGRVAISVSLSIPYFSSYKVLCVKSQDLTKFCVSYQPSATLIVYPGMGPAINNISRTF